MKHKHIRITRINMNFTTLPKNCAVLPTLIFLQTIKLAFNKPPSSSSSLKSYNYFEFFVYFKLAWVILTVTESVKWQLKKKASILTKNSTNRHPRRRTAPPPRLYPPPNSVCSRPEWARDPAYPPSSSNSEPTPSSYQCAPSASPR